MPPRPHFSIDVDASFDFRWGRRDRRYLNLVCVRTRPAPHPLRKNRVFNSKISPPLRVIWGANQPSRSDPHETRINTGFCASIETKKNASVQMAKHTYVQYLENASKVAVLTGSLLADCSLRHWRTESERAWLAPKAFHNPF